MKKETVVGVKILNYDDDDITSNFDDVADVCSNVFTEHILNQPIDHRTIKLLDKMVPWFEGADITNLTMNVLSKFLTQDNLEQVFGKINDYCEDNDYENNTVSDLCMIMILSNNNYISNSGLYQINLRYRDKIENPPFFDTEEVSELIGKLQNNEDVDIVNYLGSTFWLTKKSQNELFEKMLKAIK